MDKKEDTVFIKTVKILSEIAPKWFTILGSMLILSVLFAFSKSLDSSLTETIVFVIIIISCTLIVTQIAAIGIFSAFDYIEKDDKSSLRWSIAIILILLTIGSVYISYDLAMLISKFININK